MLFYGYVNRLKALWTLLDSELYLLTLFKGMIAFSLDSRMVDEDVRAILLRQETISL